MQKLLSHLLARSFYQSDDKTGKANIFIIRLVITVAASDMGYHFKKDMTFNFVFFFTNNQQYCQLYWLVMFRAY